MQLSHVRNADIFLSPAFPIWKMGLIMVLAYIYCQVRPCEGGPKPALGVHNPEQCSYVYCVHFEDSLTTDTPHMNSRQNLWKVGPICKVHPVMT